MSGSLRTPSASQEHSRLTAACASYLIWCNAWVFRVRGGLGQRAGTPDILACVPPSGRLVAVECKTGAGRLSRAQQRERSGLENAGAVYCLARSLDDLERALLDAGLLATPRLVELFGLQVAEQQTSSGEDGTVEDGGSTP